MRYREEWRNFERLAVKEKLYDHFEPFEGDTFNCPGFSYRDAHVMLNWLKYAATIGDASYLTISDRHIITLQDLKRPPFQQTV